MLIDFTVYSESECEVIDCVQGTGVGPGLPVPSCDDTRVFLSSGVPDSVGGTNERLWYLD